jgi:regulator of protease activity HflC (stomatin/prohibitin superfamily)
VVVDPLAFLLLLICAFANVNILRQYERAVVFTLGKFQGVKDPGLVLMIPFVQEMARFDMHIRDPDAGRYLARQSLSKGRRGAPSRVPLNA